MNGLNLARIHLTAALRSSAGDAQNTNTIRQWYQAVEPMTLQQTELYAGATEVLALPIQYSSLYSRLQQLAPGPFNHRSGCQGVRAMLPLASSLPLQPTRQLKEVEAVEGSLRETNFLLKRMSTKPMCGSWVELHTRLYAWRNDRLPDGAAGVPQDYVDQISMRVAPENSNFPEIRAPRTV
ncbi:hypothetical protein DFH09DRAFT_1079904 [Mycena vulgaris]|nr:hypothetical protein DFH09DRAFT_1079904 [Mycena vulgaris]